MFEQIRQVGMTYITSRRVWFLAMVMGLVIGPNLLLNLVTNHSISDAAHPMMFVLGMPMFFIMPFLVGQAKMQFAHSRARLMPRFFSAHLVVLGGILLTMLVVYPLVLARLVGIEPLGLLAFGVTMAAPALWGVQLNRITVMMSSMIAFYSLMTDWGMKFWIIESAEHRGLFGIIFAVGVAAIAAWLWRLCNMDEETDDYLNVYQATLARRTGSEAVEQRRVVAAQIGRSWLGTRIGDWWHAQLGGYCGGNKAGIARVLRYGVATMPVEIQGLFFVAMVICLGVFLSRFSFMGASGSNFGIYFFFGQFAILMPGQMAGELLAQRRPRLAFEMLLPASRVQLIDGLLFVSVRNSAVLWLMMNIALGIVLAMSNVEFTPRIVAMYVLLAATTTFATMALSLRVSVWPSRAKRMTVMISSWFVLLAPLIVWATLHEKVGDAPFPLIAAVLLGVGAWLLFSARRAWLNVELA
jgi:hypothetical protein